MAKEDVLKALKDYIGDDTGDSAIELMETVSDAINESDASEIETLKGKVAELEQKVVDTENTWREKYMKRFTDNTPETTTKETKDEEDNGANEDDYIEPPSFEEIANEF